MPGTKQNDDEDDYETRWFILKTYGSKCHGFSTDFQGVLSCRMGRQAFQSEYVKTFSSTYQLRGVRPWYRTHRDSKTRQERTHEYGAKSKIVIWEPRHLPTDKKIGTYDYRSRCSRITRNDPNVWSTSVRPFSKSPLNTSYKEHPETHEKCTDEKHGPATPFINVDDGGNLVKWLVSGGVMVRKEENISIYRWKQHWGRIVLTIRVKRSEERIRCSSVMNNLRRQWG